MLSEEEKQSVLRNQAVGDEVVVGFHAVIVRHEPFGMVVRPEGSTVTMFVPYGNVSSRAVMVAQELTNDKMIDDLRYTGEAVDGLSGKIFSEIFKRWNK